MTGGGGGVYMIKGIFKWLSVSMQGNRDVFFQYLGILAPAQSPQPLLGKSEAVSVGQALGCVGSQYWWVRMGFSSCVMGGVRVYQSGGQLGHVGGVGRCRGS